MQSRSLKQTSFHSSCKKKKGNWLQTGLSYLTMPLNWTTEVVHQCLHRHVCLLPCHPFSLSLYVSLPVTIWVFLVYLVPVLFWWIHPGVSRFTFHFLSLSVFQLFWVTPATLFSQLPVCTQQIHYKRNNYTMMEHRLTSPPQKGRLWF